ncbi:hypothetical protein D9Q98_001976 [Chlorella vulgaris]|uniref:Aminotransferase class IV n=1 Tax=Chlorella vulgaris TaxID=3077 RepID=A0A9D4TVJ1_CHLVU|nr:hypothetical protein D9Q98_001976 [Chlorella vulgaris]
MALTPHEFLLATPRGAYTTVLVRDGTRLVNWARHVERLERSLLAMQTAFDGFYDAYYAWKEASRAAESMLLRSLLGPPIRAALQAAHAAQTAAGDLMLMIVMVPAPAQPSGLDVRVHVHPYSSSTQAGSAVILGGPRSVPIGKDTGWVTERQMLEQQRGDAVEVLLCSEEGGVLEGLVTNFFVVAAPSDGAAAPILWTAGMHDGAVWGTVRAQVLEACAQLGIQVVEQAPRMHSRHTWTEAFLTNGLRTVQPLTSISCGAANVWGHKRWELRFPEAPGPITAAVHAALLPLLPAVDVADL